jgi:uncharacterized membrane protein YbhN (UPF0104 family)
LKYGLGLGLVAYMVWLYWEPGDGSPGLAAALHQQIRVLPLALAAAILAVSVLTTFLRWFILVLAQDLPFTVNDSIRLGFVGYYLSTFLPGSIGGDIGKAAFLAREQDRRTVAVATVIIDRVLGLAGLFWLVALVGAVYWANGWLESSASSATAAAALETIVLAAVLLTAASVAFWLLLGVLPQRRAQAVANGLGRVPKVGGPLAEMWRAVWLYRCRGRSVGLALALSIIGHVGFVLSYYFSALALCPAGTVPSVGLHFLVVPVGMVIQAGFPAPGGMGGGEFSFGKLYGLLGFAPANGVLMSLGQRALTWVLALLGALVCLRRRPAVVAEKPELAAAEV